MTRLTWALATLALLTAGCSSLTEPDAITVQKEVFPKPQPVAAPEPAAAAVPGAAGENAAGEMGGPGARPMPRPAAAPGTG